MNMTAMIGPADSLPRASTAANEAPPATKTLRVASETFPCEQAQADQHGKQDRLFRHGQESDA